MTPTKDDLVCERCKSTSSRQLNLEWRAGDARADWITSEEGPVDTSSSDESFTLSICHNCLQQHERSFAQSKLLFPIIAIVVTLFGIFYPKIVKTNLIGLKNDLIWIPSLALAIYFLVPLIRLWWTQDKPQSAQKFLSQDAIRRAQELLGKNRNFFLWNKDMGLRFVALTENSPKLFKIDDLAPIIARLPADEYAIDALQIKEKQGSSWILLTNKYLGQWPPNTLDYPFIVEGIYPTIGVLLKENWAPIIFDSLANQAWAYAFFSNLVSKIGWTILTPDLQSKDAFVVASKDASIIRNSFSNVSWPQICSVCGNPEVSKTIPVSKQQDVSMKKLIVAGPIGSTIFSGSFEANIPYCKTCSETATERPGIVPLFVKFSKESAVLFNNLDYADAFLEQNQLSRKAA